MGGLTEEQWAITAAAQAFCNRGIAIACPWEGDLDDAERERFDALVAAVGAYTKMLASPAPAESGEPVAWQHRGPRGGWITTDEKTQWSERALYAHPPAESAGSTTSGVGVTEAATKLIAHWDSMSGPEKRGEFEGVGYWSPAGRMVSTEFIVELRAALSSRDTQPALLSTDETKEGGNG